MHADAPADFLFHDQTDRCFDFMQQTSRQEKVQESDI